MDYESDVHGDEHYLSNSTGLNFFRPYFQNCLSSVHYSEDHFHIHVMTLRGEILSWLLMEVEGLTNLSKRAQFVN